VGYRLWGSAALGRHWCDSCDTEVGLGHPVSMIAWVDWR